MTNLYGYFKFRISLNGVKSISMELEDALFEAGCNDGLISIKKGIVSINFHRQAASMARAIRLAEEQIEGVTFLDGTRLRVRGYHSDDGYGSS